MSLSILPFRFRLRVDGVKLSDNTIDIDQNAIRIPRRRSLCVRWKVFITIIGSQFDTLRRCRFELKKKAHSSRPGSPEHHGNSEKTRPISGDWSLFKTSLGVLEQFTRPNHVLIDESRLSGADFATPTLLRGIRNGGRWMLIRDVAAGPYAKRLL